MDKIHGPTPVMSTVTTQQGQFETYVTIGNFTRRYDNPLKKNASAVEADAMYCSLRHMTNVLGYKIVDLNYATLSALVTDIDTWNAQINALQLCNMYAMV